MQLMLNYTLDHIGIAVADIEHSIEFYRASYGFELSHREVITSQDVEVAFLKLPNTSIELLAARGASSKLSAFLAKKGPGLHHICYRVDDIERELARLKSLGFTLLDETPRPGAHGTRIAFLHPKSCEGVLTELCEYPR